jgi:hypothetical protein
VGNQVLSTMDGLTNILSRIFAISASLTNAVGASLGIIAVFGIFQSSFIFIPSTIYWGIAGIVFTSSVLAWAVIHYKSMHAFFCKKVSKPTPSSIAKDAHKDCVELYQKTNAYLLKLNEPEINEKTFNQFLFHQVNREFNIISKMESFHQNYHNRLMQRRSIMAFCYRITYYIPFIHYILPHMAIPKQLTNLRASLGTLKDEIQSHCETKGWAISGEEFISTVIKANQSQQKVQLDYLFESTLASLPPAPIDVKINAMSTNTYIRTRIETFLSSVYALFSNSAVMIIGSLEALTLLAPLSPFMSMSIMGAFIISGYISASSSDKPMVDKFNRLKATLSTQSKAFVARMRAKSSKLSMLNFDHTSRDMLGYLLSITATIFYFMSSTVFAEFLLNNMSLTDPISVSQIMFNPFTASYAAIALGVLSAIATYRVISTMILQSQLQIPDPDDINYQGNLKRIGQLFIGYTCLSYSFCLMSLLTAATISLQAVILGLMTASIAGLAATSLHAIYDFCVRSRHSIFTKIIFTLGLGAQAITGGITSALNGSVYHRLFGKLPAIMVGTCYSAAQLEHIAPIFQHAADQFDTVIQPSATVKNKAAAGA